MQPLSLTLKGFRGVRDDLGLDTLTLDFERLADGAELIAIAGANGRGKTTVMDNMHPYLTMPSRASVAGPGGFSYYEHMFFPEIGGGSDSQTVQPGAGHLNPADAARTSL